MVWPTRLVFLAMGDLLSFGLNLAVSSPSDRKGNDTYCIVAIEDKKMGFISYCMSLSLYMMSYLLMHYSVLHKLNTLDAALQKKYTSVMIRVCHSRLRFLSCMYIHDDFMTESR